MFNQPDKQWNELEQRFSQLAPKINDGPEKEAISILHGLILENRRDIIKPGDPSPSEIVQNPPDHVANLYKTAPGMSGAAINQGLAVGEKAPQFTLPDGNGRPVSLSDFRGSLVVLVFYPLDWSPACSDQLSLYESELTEFQRLGSQVVGISVDSLYSHGAWAFVRKITFPLLSDFQPRGETARAYQVYRSKEGFSERAIYIIDSAGIIQYRCVSPELPKIPDIYELFDALKKIKSMSDSANRK